MSDEIAHANLTPEMTDSANAAGHNLAIELRDTRIVLNADMLASLVAPRANFETDFPNTIDGKRAFFFTVDGVLNGKKVHGALFAGECILVFAENFLLAQQLANQGLRDTVRLLHEEYEARGTEIEIESGGRRTVEGAEERLDPFTKKMLAHVLGGLPWQN
jgi:hypothetical protein